MNIELTPGEWDNHHRSNVVWFSAIDDAKAVDGAISIDALTEHFGTYAADLLPAFKNHRQQIWDIATKLSAERRFEDNGTIMIQSADLKADSQRRECSRSVRMVE